MAQKLLLVLIAIGLVSGQFVRVNFSNSIAITFLDVMVCLAALYIFISAWLHNKLNQIFSHKLFPPVVFFVGISLFSLIVNSFFMRINETFTASLYLVRWFVFFMLMFFTTARDKRFFKQMIFIMGVGTLLIGYWQYFFFNSIKKLFPLGWDEHMYRMVGGFLDPNFAGPFYVLFFLFTLSYFIRSFSKHKLKPVILYACISIFSFIAIYLTFSRSAMIMLIVSLGVFLFLSKRERLFFFSLAAILVLFILFSDVRVESKNPFRVFSSEARITSAKEAITLISKSPLIGVGFNAYRYGQRRFGLPTDANLYKSHAEAGTDNSFLFIFATTGIVGLIAFLYFLFRIGEYIKENKEDSFYMKNAKIAGLIGLCADSFFVNSLFFPMILCFLWLWFGFTEKE